MNSRRGRSAAPFSLFAFQDIITSVTGIMLLVTMMLALELLKHKESSPPIATRNIAADLEADTRRMQAEIEALRAQLATDNEVIEYSATNLRQRLTTLTELGKQLELQTHDLSGDKHAAVERLQEIDRLRKIRDISPTALQQLLAKMQHVEQEVEKLRKSNRVIFNKNSGDTKEPWLVQLDGEALLAAPLGRVGPPQRFATVPQFLQWAKAQSTRSDYFVLLLKPAAIETFVHVRDSLQKGGFDIGYDLLTPNQTAIDPETGAGIGGQTSE